MTIKPKAHQGPTFREWHEQRHDESNTSLAGRRDDPVRTKVQRLIAENARDRMTDPDELDCNGDVTVHSGLDQVPWEPEGETSRLPTDEELAQVGAHPDQDNPCAGFEYYEPVGWSNMQPPQNKRIQQRARGLLEDDAEPLTMQEIFDVFWRFEWLRQEANFV